MELFEARLNYDCEGYASLGIFDTVTKAIEATKLEHMRGGSEVVRFELNRAGFDKEVTVWEDGKFVEKV